MDIHGHGTHVAGIAAAVAHNGVGGAGVAFNTQVMAVRAAQETGVLVYDDIAEGILYAVDNGADVINMSFGDLEPSQTESDALAYAASKNVLPVCAAGNEYGNVVIYRGDEPWAFASCFGASTFMEVAR